MYVSTVHVPCFEAESEVGGGTGPPDEPPVERLFLPYPLGPPLVPELPPVAVDPLLVPEPPLDVPPPFPDPELPLATVSNPLDEPELELPPLPELPPLRRGSVVPAGPPEHAAHTTSDAGSQRDAATIIGNLSELKARTRVTFQEPRPPSWDTPSRPKCTSRSYSPTRQTSASCLSGCCTCRPT